MFTIQGTARWTLGQQLVLVARWFHHVQHVPFLSSPDCCGPQHASFPSFLLAVPGDVEEQRLFNDSTHEGRGRAARRRAHGDAGLGTSLFRWPRSAKSQYRCWTRKAIQTKMLSYTLITALEVRPSGRWCWPSPPRSAPDATRQRHRRSFP